MQQLVWRGSFPDLQGTPPRLKSPKPSEMLQVLGVFDNGRIEELLPARDCLLEELDEPETQVAIAKRIGEFHRLSAPLGCAGAKCGLWPQMQSWWAGLLPPSCMDPSSMCRKCSNACDKGSSHRLGFFSEQAQLLPPPSYQFAPRRGGSSQQE